MWQNHIFFPGSVPFWNRSPALAGKLILFRQHYPLSCGSNSEMLTVEFCFHTLASVTPRQNRFAVFTDHRPAGHLLKMGVVQDDDYVAHPSTKQCTSRRQSAVQHLHKSNGRLREMWQSHIWTASLLASPHASALIIMLNKRVRAHRWRHGCAAT